MMRTARALVYVLTGLACIAFMFVHTANAQDAPEDVLKKFPAERYLHRPGTGETPEEAAESARFQVAAYFEAKISGENIVRQWAQSTSSRGETLEKSLSEITNTVIVGANRDIPGIEIAKTEENRKRNIYEAWAVLDKANYATVLKDRIAGIDRDVDSRLTREGDNGIGELRNLSAIMRSLVLRQRSRHDLMLLDSGAAPPSRDEELRTVMTRLDDLIANAFDVGVVFTGDVKTPVRSGIVKGVVDAGIRLKEYLDVSSAKNAGAGLVLMVEHSVSHKDVSFRQRTFSNVDWVLSVRAADAASGEIIDALVLNDKMAGAANEAQAEDRMIKRILTAQVPEVSKWVYDVVFKPNGQ